LIPVEDAALRRGMSMLRRSVSLGVVLAAAPWCGVASGATLHGIRSTDIVRFDTTNVAGTLTTVGAHGIPASQFATLLTHHRGDGMLYGRRTEPVGDGTFDYMLYRFDAQTGVGEFVANLGNTTVVGALGFVEYADGIGAILVSRGAGVVRSELLTIGEGGALVPLLDTMTDHVAAAFDTRRNRLYSVNVGATQLSSTDLSTGVVTPIGPASTFNEMVYVPCEDVFYARTSAGVLHRLVTTDGGAPVSSTPLALLPGPQFGGLAYVPNLSCPLDLDCDGLIGFGDLNTVLGQYGRAHPGVFGDLDGDDVVGFADLNLLLDAYGTSCE
jgi:hypothetical protein